MTSTDVLRFAMSKEAPSSAVATDDDFLRASIVYHLRNFSLNVGTIDFLQTTVHSRRISGAVFFAMDARQLKLLIADARTSIVLALQRHLGNERYRKRLRNEPHYRALRPHLSASFRVMMMPQSNWAGYRFSEGRDPSLALAYQEEIDRLETELLAAPEKVSPHIIRHVAAGKREREAPSAC